MTFINTPVLINYKKKKKKVEQPALYLANLLPSVAEIGTLIVTDGEQRGGGCPGRGGGVSH